MRSTVLFPPGDLGALTASVIRLIDQPQLRASLGRAAAARANAELSWTDNARRVLSVCAAASQRGDKADVVRPYIRQRGEARP